MKPFRSTVVFVLPTLLTGCFTMGLWGFELEDERDPVTGQEDACFAYDDETEWSWELFGLRVLLTPVAVGLDCLTCPVQAFLWGDEDDGDDCGCRR